MDKTDADIREWMQGTPGVHVIGRLTPGDFLQRVADSDMPGALFAKLCLEHPEIQIGEKLRLDHD